MSQVIKFDHMRVGRKGGGKHWTQDEIDRRVAATQKFERKKKRKLKIPDWLSDEARKVWRKTVKDMEEFGVLDKVDEDVLGTYCDIMAKYKEANEQIDIYGTTEMGSTGTRVVSAHVKMAQSYARIILSYSDKLGLNANARARLAKADADPKEDDNEHLFD